MKFNIKREILLSAVQKTLGIVEKKTTMPILNNLLLKATLNEVVVIATDMEIGLTASYQAEILEEGEVTLPAKKLYEMVREIQGDNIHVSKREKDIVVLKCNKAIYHILGMPSDDYPIVEQSVDFTLYPIKMTILYELMKKTYFSIANDDLRKNLNGALLETEKYGDHYRIRMVSTDGHRLALSHSELVSNEFFLTEVDKSVIIPKKGIGEMMRLLEDSQSEEALIGVGNGVFVLKIDHTTLRERLIDSAYPDYRRIIPADRGIKIILDRDQLLHAVRRMFVITSEKYNNMIITISSGKASFSSANSDIGEADDEIEINYEGESLSIGYNVKYIAEAVEPIGEKNIEFEINGDMKPTIIRGSGNEDYFCIVMPLKIH
jgi:DNA polymerase-3 subunit beta